MESGSSRISGNSTDYSTDTTEVLSDSLMEYDQGSSTTAESDAGDGEVSSEYSTADGSSSGTSVNPNAGNADNTQFSLVGVDPRSWNRAEVISYTNYLIWQYRATILQHPAIYSGYPVAHWAIPIIPHAGIIPVTGTLPTVPPVAGIIPVPVTLPTVPLLAGIIPVTVLPLVPPVAGIIPFTGTLPTVPPVGGIVSVVPRPRETGGTFAAGAGTSSAMRPLGGNGPLQPGNDGSVPEHKSMAIESEQYCKMQQDKKQKGVLIEEPKPSPSIIHHKDSSRKPVAQSASSILAQAFSRSRVCLNLSLRDYLTSCNCSQLKLDVGANKAENLKIFRQVVQIVDAAQGEGIILTDMRPSMFVFVSPGLHLRYTGALVLAESRSLTSRGKRKMDLEDEQGYHDSQFWATYCCQNYQTSSLEDPEFVQLEKKWYNCVDQRCGDNLGADTVYGLGVLWFELLVKFESPEKYSAALADLSRQILPQHLNAEDPIAVGFCVRLLNPATRPSTRQILDTVNSF